MEAKASNLFEVSWEVCNKVGGIYTVVTSKILPMLKFYGDGYFAVGPYFNKKAVSGEFQEEPVPDEFQDIFETLKSKKIICHFGKWLIEGSPKTILVDYSGFSYAVNDIKKDFWDKYKIDSLGSQYHDYDEPMVWSTAVGMLIEEYAKRFPDKKVVGHFHEWMSGGALLYLEGHDAKVGTVFTTHATMLGRSLAMNGVDLYEKLETLNPDEYAYKYGIQAKYLSEKACAKVAGAFTTVSEITGIEAESLLGKKPDVLLPNGLDIEKFPTFEEASLRHMRFKGKIQQFLEYFFFPYYSFELEDTLVYFICGRYEFRDKGIDVFIHALSRFNQRLIKEKSKKNIVAFIWVPGQGKAIRHEIVENKAYYEDIKDSVEDAMEDVSERILESVLSKQHINEETIFDKNLQKELTKKHLRFLKEGIPPLTTHHLYDENDIVLRTLREANLINKQSDNVKVVYYPIYLTGADQLLDLTYYEALTGSHLGIFPSYYEPWGYTPLETSALGVSSVTTDLAGFGRYVKHEAEGDIPGIFVMGRHKKSNEDAVKQLADIMYRFANYSKQERIECKIKAKRLASHADWKVLVDNYIKAHNLAVDKAWEN